MVVRGRVDIEDGDKIDEERQHRSRQYGLRRVSMRGFHGNDMCSGAAYEKKRDSFWYVLCYHASLVNA